MLALLAGLLPVIVMFIGSWKLKRELGGLMVEELELFGQSTVSQISLDVYSMCEAIDTLVNLTIDDSLKQLDRDIKKEGKLKLSDKIITWQALNQKTHKVTEINLPAMMIGNTIIEKNSDPKKLTPVVDNIVGATCTIFQKMNDNGDMLRVATSVISKKGRRAIGTYIPYTSPVVQKILSGKPFIGRAFVVDKWYLSGYIPYKNSKGELIGMVYVGVPFDALETVASTIDKIHVGKNGYVAILGASGDEKGKYIFAGKNKDLKGMQAIGTTSGGEQSNSIIKMIDKAKAAPSGEPIVANYFLKDAKGENHKKIAGVVYFKQWDWIIIAGAYAKDFEVSRGKVEKRVYSMATYMSAVGLGVLLIVFIITFIVSGQIAGPVSRITEIARCVADGDLKTAIDKTEADFPRANDSTHGDETCQLVHAVTVMTKSLDDLVGQVKISSVQLLSSATQVASTAKHQQGSLSDLGTSTNEIAASIKEISATSQDLASTINNVSNVADDTSNLANDGRQGLDEMQAQIRGLSDATQSISSKLSLINDKAANINSVVTAINKIAEQTNLLSLNAAIEAEKAGEHGQGFSVVAREIRRLADQTANATLDIEQMVKEMQAAVSTGVMEMDKFSKSMSVGVDQSIRLSEQMEEIINHVDQLTPKFQAVSEGMNSQSQGASQINDAMMQLTHSTQVALEAVSELNDSANMMRQSVTQLSDNVRKFKVRKETDNQENA